MQNQQGIILVIILIYLTMISWLSIAALESSIVEKKILNNHINYNQLFADAEQTLTMAENQIALDKLPLSLSSSVVTDQQLIDKNLPHGVIQNCSERNETLGCYYIELMTQEQCDLQNTLQNEKIRIYRVSASATMKSSLFQQVILQSTFISMPNGIQKCLLTQSQDKIVLHYGRQSWREIS